MLFAMASKGGITPCQFYNFVEFIAKAEELVGFM